MSRNIKDVFDENLNIKITKPIATAIIRYVNIYETKDSHAEAFNSPYLGLHPCYFLNKDRDEFFSLFDVDYSEVKGLVSKFVTSENNVFGVKMTDVRTMIVSLWKDHYRAAMFGMKSNLSTGDIRKTIQEMGSIDANYKVASDPFNLFTIYACHLAMSSKELDKSTKLELVYKMLMLLQYKFFTSLVNHRFPYRPEEEAMRGMYEGLTEKFDIKRKGSWRAIMMDRAEVMVYDENSLHYDTLVKFDDDKQIIYILSDTQTRIRNQVNIITTEFMNYKQSQDRIGTYTNVGTDLDGDKTIIDSTATFDGAVSYLYNDALVTAKFLDDRAIKICTGLFAILNTARIREVLLRFSEIAVNQNKTGESDLIKTIKGEEIIVGSRLLLQSIIEVSYRYCMRNGTNIKRPADMIKSVRDAYGSSRINDPDILKVRDSVNHLMLQVQSSRRVPTLASLRIMFVVYLIILSFKYVK